MKLRVKSLCEVAAILFLLVTIVLLATHYAALPEQIHTPINGGGDTHGMGDRIQLWLFVVISGWIYVLMSLFNLVPVEGMNVSPSMGQPQRERLLQTVKLSMTCFKACVMAGSFLWLWRIIAHARG
jgi:hypothetical protein